MSAFVDTNILVRYLTGDPPELYRQALSIIESGEDLFLTGIVLAETAYVLTRFYRLPREVVVDTLVALVSRENIRLHDFDVELAIRALLLCRPSGRVSFADALLWATARSAGAQVVYSLDRNFPAEGLEVRAAP